MDFDNFPEGWAVVKLEKCVEILDNKRIPINSSDREKRIQDKLTDQLYPYYGATGQVGFIDDYLFDEELILLGEDAAPFLELNKRKAYIIKGKTWVNNHAHVLKSIKEIIISEYLENYLNRFDYHEYVTGTTRLKLNQSRMKDIPVLLPPLNEQKRIVAKIEQIQEKSQVVKNELEKIKVLLKKLRRSLLASAFRGDLTKDWRANHPDIEPVAVFKENILDNNLPEKWFVTEIGNIIESLRYGTSKKCDYQVNGIGVLRIPNIVNGSVDCTDLKYTELTPQEMQSVNLIAGDLLMIRSNGSPSLVGRTALITELENNLSYAGYLIRIRPNQKLVDPAYLNLWFSSDKIRFQIEMPLRSTNGINNINSNEVKLLTIPLAPLEEQKEIVKKLEKMMKFADQVEERVKEAEEKLNKFNQSVLAKAFRGELVPQDPNDEPATVLLGKIQQEKNKTTSKKTKK